MVVSQEAPCPHLGGRREAGAAFKVRLLSISSLSVCLHIILKEKRSQTEGRRRDYVGHKQQFKRSIFADLLLKQ